jgi:hypothetical protein
MISIPPTTQHQSQNVYTPRQNIHNLQNIKNVPNFTNLQNTQNLQLQNVQTQNKTLQPRQYSTTMPKTSTYVPNTIPPTNFIPPNKQNIQNIYQSNRAYNNNIPQANGYTQPTFPPPPSSQPQLILNLQPPSYQPTSLNKDRLLPSNNV